MCVAYHRTIYTASWVYHAQWSVFLPSIIGAIVALAATVISFSAPLISEDSRNHTVIQKRGHMIETNQLSHCTSSDRWSQVSGGIGSENIFYKIDYAWMLSIEIILGNKYISDQWQHTSIYQERINGNNIYQLMPLQQKVAITLSYILYEKIFVSLYPGQRCYYTRTKLSHTFNILSYLTYCLSTWNGGVQLILYDITPEFHTFVANLGGCARLYSKYG